MILTKRIIFVLDQQEAMLSACFFKAISIKFNSSKALNNANILFRPYNVFSALPDTNFCPFKLSIGTTLATFSK